MATAPAALDAYREEADRFIAALDEEYYLHFAGLKEDFELSPIYERYSDLATLDACRRIGEAAGAGERGGVELWRFACEGYMGDLTREAMEEIAKLEATLTADVDGEEIGFRLLRPALANEPDRGQPEVECQRIGIAVEARNREVLRDAHASLVTLREQFVDRKSVV